MSTTAPEAGAQQTGQQQPPAAPAAGAVAPPAAPAAPPAGQQQPPAAGQTPPAAGQQAPPAGQGDELTAEEEAALGDPGKRALARVKEERNTLREQHTTVAAELEQTRTQLQAAMAQIAQGGDQAQQAALQTATTERDQAQQQLERVTAVLRNGVVMPQPGEQPQAWAARALQTAQLLQGSDAAALDNSARVLLSLIGGAPGQQTATPPPPPIPNGDAAAGQQGGGQAGDLSMSDRIRAAAGRQVR